MANKLLRSGSIGPHTVVHMSDNPEVPTMSDTKPVQRCFLYSPDCPEGKIFEGADAIAAAQEDGWEDSPANLVAEEKPTKKGKKTGGKGATSGDNSK